MSTLKKDQRLTLVIDEDSLRQIDEWMDAHRIRSRGEAIRRLLDGGLTIPDLAATVANNYRSGINDPFFNSDVDKLADACREYFTKLDDSASNIRHSLGAGKSHLMSQRLDEPAGFDVIIEMLDHYLSNSSIRDRELTMREREIVMLVDAGKSDEDIAHALNISVHTVRVYVRSIMNKLDVTSREEIPEAAPIMLAAQIKSSRADF